MDDMLFELIMSEGLGDPFSLQVAVKNLENAVSANATGEL